MRRKPIIGIVIIASFLLMAFAPLGTVKADVSGGHIVANYVVVPQSSEYDYRKIVSNSIGEARGYVFRGINGAEGYRVVFVELVRHSKGNNWDIEEKGYYQYIMATHGETFVYCNAYGSFSPYPRNEGKDYDDTPGNIHNAIGSHEGGFVEVARSLKYENWHVYQGNSGNWHWITHQHNGDRTGSWDYAAMGGAFYFGNSQHTIRVTIVKWKMVTGWWFWEQHKDMLSGNILTVYLKTS